MESILGGVTDPSTLILLVLALGLALSFEFVNGFHDTANAVATVIYTHSLPPNVAVAWSGLCNFLGVLLSAGTVAFGIVALLPVELIVNVGSGAGFAMVFALLLAAIIWNLGTWYLGLPASSSHTLIGSIVGVGLMNSWIAPGLAFGEGVNWGKVQDVGMALLVSPLVGFVCAALLFWLARLLVRDPRLYAAPEGKAPPPAWIRGLLVLTCTGVSFAHGSNDGQKGMGLILLILVGILPASYALNLATDRAELGRTVAAARAVDAALAAHASAPHVEGTVELSRYLTTGKAGADTLPALVERNRVVLRLLEGRATLSELDAGQRRALRKELYLVQETAGRLLKSGSTVALEPAARGALGELRGHFKGITSFIPSWVKVAVAVALGLGTMIGWQRIVTTVGEKIGKSHLTYAQGGSAELVAMATIGAADILGLPVSTTHVLSSGVAGTMFANRSGLQQRTLRNLLLAWVLTLPVCVLLGAGLFAMGLMFVFRVLGMH